MIPTATSPCPDCAAVLSTVDMGRGLVVVSIAHDDTCPTWRGMNGHTAA